MSHPREEVEAAVARYVEVRERMDRGDGGWEEMAALFTDDATYIDPAWGRIDGIDEIRTFMRDSMAGLEDWLFPIEWIAIDGDHVVVKWTQRLPGQRADGSHYDNSGVSLLTYAGEGRFSQERGPPQHAPRVRGHPGVRLAPRQGLQRPTRAPPPPVGTGPLMGRVTFLLTDVESSTRLWEERPDLAGRIMDRHAALIEAAVVSEGGAFLKHRGEGDSTFSVFTSAGDAVSAAVELQRALAGEAWPHREAVRVRAALYTGEAELRDGDYHGVGPNRAGRLRALAAGGQILCTESTRVQVDALPPAVTLRDLGLHRLRDVARAERVFQVDHPDLAHAFPTLRSPGVRHNLPAARNRFVGRVDELDAVRGHLDASRTVTLVGVGGCGKTRLAVEVASGQLEHFPDGVFFADLAPIGDPAEAPGVVANALGHTRLSLGTASGHPRAELIDFLSSRQVLLVLDNCEHVIDAIAALVDDVLDRCPAVRVLATSREALEVQGEQVVPLSPLEGGDSMVLFCDRASLADPRFALAGEDASHVADICRLLDGIPLALEIAAAQAAHLSVGEIRERVAERLDAFAGGRRRAPRQQTLHAALDWSHDLLSPDELVVFRRLGAFPGSFGADGRGPSATGPTSMCCCQRWCGSRWSWVGGLTTIRSLAIASSRPCGGTQTRSSRRRPKTPCCVIVTATTTCAGPRAFRLSAPTSTPTPSCGPRSTTCGPRSPGPRRAADSTSSPASPAR